MKEILLLGIAREGSTRVKDKMTRKLYKGKSLFSIYLEKFEKIAKEYNSPFSDVAFAICPEDKKLWDMAFKYNVPLLNRDKNSITGLKPLSELLSCIDSFKYNYKYVMVVNGCLSFLTIKTINDSERYV